MTREQGEPPDLDAVYRACFPLVYNYVFYRILHKEDTEDLVSQIFLKVVRNWDRYDAGKSSVKTWVMTIAETALIDFYRRRRVNVSLDDEESGVAETLGVDFEAEYDRITDERRKAAYRALCALPDRDRLFLYQKYFMGMTNREIARRLNMNESTVGAVMARARAKLKVTLTDAGFGDSAD